MIFPVVVQSEIPHNFPFMWENDVLRIHTLVPYIVESGNDKEMADSAIGFLSEIPEKSFVRWWWFLRDVNRSYKTLNVQRKAALQAMKEKPPVSTCVQISELETDFLMIGVFIPSFAPKTYTDAPSQFSDEKYETSSPRMGTFDFLGENFFSMSGTAAINKRGETVHCGNGEKQMLSAKRILETSISKKCGGFKEINYHWWFDEKKMNVNLDRHSKSNAIICRNDLFCEVEAVGRY